MLWCIIPFSTTRNLFSMIINTKMFKHQVRHLSTIMREIRDKQHTGIQEKWCSTFAFDNMHLVWTPNLGNSESPPSLWLQKVAFLEKCGNWAFRNLKESQWHVATFESFQSIITLKIYTQIHPWERDPRFLGMQPSLLTDSWFYTLLVVSYILHHMICRYPIANFTTHDELEAMLKVKLNNPS